MLNIEQHFYFIVMYSNKMVFQIPKTPFLEHTKLEKLLDNGARRLLNNRRFPETSVRNLVPEELDLVPD